MTYKTMFIAMHITIYNYTHKCEYKVGGSVSRQIENKIQ